MSGGGGLQAIGMIGLAAAGTVLTGGAASPLLVGAMTAGSTAMVAAGSAMQAKEAKDKMKNLTNKLTGQKQREAPVYNSTNTEKARMVSLRNLQQRSGRSSTALTEQTFG